MTKLATNAELIARLDVQCTDEPSIVQRADSALVAATSHIETFLRGGFERKRVVDTWYLSDHEFPQNKFRTNLALAKGFVVRDDDNTVEVRLDPLLDNVPDMDPIEDRLVHLDLVKGRLWITTTDGRRPLFRPFVLRDETYCQVTYTAGFRTQVDTSNRSCALSKVYRNVPEWLKEAALQVAREIWVIDVANLETNLRERRGSEPARGTNRIFTLAETLMTPHMRYFPEFQNPMIPEVEAA